MRIFIAILALLVVGLVLVDVFNTIILARRTRHFFRITRVFYRLAWSLVRGVARHIQSSRLRESVLGTFGPASLLLLFSLWVAVLILAFAALQWATGFQAADRESGLMSDLYFSATTLFTIDTGQPKGGWSRAFTALEGALGFSIFGLVIGYLPVFYQAFSKRELLISLLDARASSPPSALSLLAIGVERVERVERYLEMWEQWTAELLENQLSFPMMAWFRSHHANQSWLTAATTVIDTCAVVCICGGGDVKKQAEYTFAMGRHALVDISISLGREPKHDGEDRLPAEEFRKFRQALQRSGSPLNLVALTEERLREMRKLYEPYALVLSEYLMMALPDWDRKDEARENWKQSPGALQELPYAVSDEFQAEE